MDALPPSKQWASFGASGGGGAGGGDGFSGFEGGNTTGHWEQFTS